MSGTKLPLTHKTFARRLHSRGVGGGGEVGEDRRAAATERRSPAFLPSSPLHIVLDG